MACTVGTNLSGQGGIVSISGLRVAGRVTEVTINSVTWTPLPAVAFANRNALGIQNISAVEIKLQYDNTVGSYTGIVIPSGAERFYDITDEIVIYAKSQAGSPVIVIEEIS